MIGSVSNLYHLRQSNPEKALEKACKEFEAIFAHQLLKTMGESISDDGLLEQGLADDMYRDMLYTSIAQSVSETGSLGISKILLKGLKASE